ncbi:hypothetical protein RJ640_026061 [Escallonia rubra]|uniref:Leucine-rich repeat-containing N-terminal plant-type domain-containing protein n=1 Tax=Escallonia rubra TaxID=112253 RepID=A0AA88RTD4_9ASTE|nr:hypothetical protein RJ640_026061 [Escallonia rubra]
MKLHLQHIFTSICVALVAGHAVGDDNLSCKDWERQALLKIKQGLIDDYSHLSSWGNAEDKKNCCKWRGVSCSNQTGHVTSLDLRGTCTPFDTSYLPLRGNISSSLLELKHLNYLDLSCNDFGRNRVPEFIGSLVDLRYLNLTYAGYVGTVPDQLGNLTNLQYLDLRSNYHLDAKSLEWLSHLSLLRYLDLSEMDLSKATDWLQAIFKLPLLIELHLSSCQLVPPPLLLPLTNSTLKSLAVIDLSANYLTSSSLYYWLFNISSTLVKVELSVNNLQGPIPGDFGNMKFLQYLGLGANIFEGGVPNPFGNLSRLQYLDLSLNELNQDLPTIVRNLSGPVQKSLVYLDFGWNRKITGLLPDVTGFSSLRFLNLRDNKLSGSIPKSYGQLPVLFALDLGWNQIEGPVPDFTSSLSLKELYLQGNKLNGTSLGTSIAGLSSLLVLDVSTNSLDGVVSEADMSKLSRLLYLDLSSNSLSLEFSSEWVPPFQLDVIRLGGCKLQSHFPRWLQTQTNVSMIDISHAGILDTIPDWFWDHSHRIEHLNLSHNQIYGILPDLSSKFSEVFASIYLGFNNFSGPIPLFPSNLTALDLSKNSFSGPVSFLCNPTPFLTYLDLSDNLLSGELPDCWKSFGKLSILNMGNNNLSGKVPISMGSLSAVETIHLRNNHLVGKLPKSLKNCTKLTFIDLGQNRLTGKIPAWIGNKLSDLVFLSLSSNEFYGNIPLNICRLARMQILDLSLNNISGNIPECLGNFTAMASEESSSLTITHSFDSYFYPYFDTALLVWKGREFEYKNTLGLVKSIDLSSNKLVGEIPFTLPSLAGLVALNLSRNNLSGLISPNMGRLGSLNFLDLSRNGLSGGIPIALSQLSHLGVLDLSYNFLSGRIPESNHLLTFEASSFAGNAGLCGRPLPRSCPGDDVPGGGDNTGNHDGEDKLIDTGFYVSLGVGIIVGFWGFCGSLILSSSWRYAFFKPVNSIEDWLYVRIATTWARLWR